MVVSSGIPSRSWIGGVGCGWLWDEKVKIGGADDGVRVVVCGK